MATLPTTVHVYGIDEPILFVLHQPVIECRDGHREVTYVAFTPTGTRSRTARTSSSGWVWQCAYDGEKLDWRPLHPYDEGETPEARRAWHERENGMQLVTHEVGG